MSKGVKKLAFFGDGAFIKYGRYYFVVKIEQY